MGTVAWHTMGTTNYSLWLVGICSVSTFKSLCPQEGARKRKGQWTSLTTWYMQNHCLPMYLFFTRRNTRSSRCFLLKGDPRLFCEYEKRNRMKEKCFRAVLCFSTTPKTVPEGKKVSGKWLSRETLVRVPKIFTHFKIHSFSPQKT